MADPSAPYNVSEEVEHDRLVALPLKSGATAPPASVLDKFQEELPGWHGYIEWEKYPEKKALAKEILKRYQFQHPPEFQLVPLPKTNPMLEGVRWKQYHYALGDKLKDIPAESWEYIRKEKAKDMIHVLGFPYNGEPPRVSPIFKDDVLRYQ